MCMIWMKSASFAQEFRPCEGGTKSLTSGMVAVGRSWRCRHIWPFFRLSVQTSSIVYLAVQSHMGQTKRASFVQEFCRCVGTTKTHLWNGRSRPTMMLLTHTANFFRLSVQTSCIVYVGVWSCMGRTKRASFVQEFRRCVGTTKLTYRMVAVGWPWRSVDTYGQFLSVISSDLVHCISASMITHETNENSIICTRISSLRGGHKNSPMEWL
jgi:hypothetical protein